MIKDDLKFESFKQCEDARNQVINDHTIINFQDHGEGSKVLKSNRKSISKIAKNALSYPYQCRVMYRLSRFLQSEVILELGTSLGISSLYFSGSNENCHVHTIEGDPTTYQIARQMFKRLGKSNISSYQGLFNEVLPDILNQIPKVDLCFIDGHHNGAATMEYYEQIESLCNIHSAIILDDIYWSRDMLQSWEQIKQRPNVTLSIDLFFCGIIFFRPIDLEKKHLKIRPDQLLFHI